MNIGVIIAEGIQVGGGFQYALSTALVLHKNRSEKYNFIFFTTSVNNLGLLRKYGIKSHLLPLSKVDHFTGQLKSWPLVSKILSELHISVQSKLDRLMAKHNIDLIYPITQSYLPLFSERFNYIFTLLDLCHRDCVEFPEVARAREFELRDEMFRRILPKAVAVLTDSLLGRENAIRRYCLDAERVVALPMLPSPSVTSLADYKSNYYDVKDRYSIDGDYIFYPAQFWPHKNHVYILEGMKILLQKFDRKVYAVFSGTDKGNLSYVLEMARKLGLEEQIRYIGFVDGQEMPHLYSQALALVMPTYFGPTNIPPLEAFYLGCPVLYSDLPGLRDQVEGAALLMDLENPISFAENIMKLYTSPEEVSLLIDNGKSKIMNWSERDFWLVLKKIFDDYEVKRKCWM